MSATVRLYIRPTYPMADVRDPGLLRETQAPRRAGQPTLFLWRSLQKKVTEKNHFCEGSNPAQSENGKQLSIKLKFRMKDTDEPKTKHKASCRS
jgi:hypothetical protein